jgi:hypothetical protein
MTKLEELKAAVASADAVIAARDEAWAAAWYADNALWEDDDWYNYNAAEAAAFDAAWNAYKAELEKTQEEKQND